MPGPVQESEDEHPTGWGVYFADDGQPHVCPMNDFRPHVIDENCWCGPMYDEGVVVHHSIDRREEYEVGRELS
jgi:hypothetical protein